MSASKKINPMALIRTLTISTTAFERRKEKFDGFRQTVETEKEGLLSSVLDINGEQQWGLGIYLLYLNI